MQLAIGQQALRGRDRASISAVTAGDGRRASGVITPKKKGMLTSIGRTVTPSIGTP